MKSDDERMREEAEKRGWSPDDLSLRQYRTLALAIRPARRKAADVWRAGSSVVMTGLGFRVVSLEQAALNEKICRACPKNKFRELRGGAFACDACQCSGKRFLMAKWSDREEHCPLGFWDNRMAP